MSYGMSLALQTAVFQHLSADLTLAGLVGGAVFDALPPGPLPSLYVALGSEDVRDWSDKTDHGAIHRIKISVVSDNAGFADAKTAAAAISDALTDANLSLARGHLVGIDFQRARALRISGGAQRRIDLTFRARVTDTLT